MDHKMLVVFVYFGFGLISSHALLREYHYVKLLKTWADAQTFCRTNYTDLATIENVNDISRLTRPNLDVSLAWIGLNDDSKCWKRVMGNDFNSWRWSATGKTSVTGYQNWAPSQPNNIYGNQSCVVMNSGGMWNDEACDFRTAFVCYTENNSTGQITYTVIADVKTRGDALAYCRTYHTDLAMIESAEQNAAIASLTSSLTTWIGLYRVLWKWSDNSSSSFKNWQAGLPNNYDSNDFCAAENSKHLWQDMSCGTKNFFWCHKALNVKAMTILRIQFQTDAGLSDSATNVVVLQQLGTVLTNAALSDFQMKWIIQPYKGGARTHMLT